MRGLIWRETFVNVVEPDASLEFGDEVFKRLQIEPTKSRFRAKFVFTASTASGLPRQVQRTLDLMTKLPASASGEAFSGMLRIVDLYLLALQQTFLPAFFSTQSLSRSLARMYMHGASDSLREWAHKQ